MLGGSASYFAPSATFFTHVRVVAWSARISGPWNSARGEDHGISTRGREGGRRQGLPLAGPLRLPVNEAETLDRSSTSSPLARAGREGVRVADVFLGNIQPDLQSQVRSGDGARWWADTMNFWIDTARDSLPTSRRVDCLRQRRRAAQAHRRAQPGPRRPRHHGIGPADRGRQARRVRRGPLHRRRHLRDARPPWPRSATRPAPETPSPAASSASSTASAPTARARELRQAMVMGSAMASFNVEDFGTDASAASGAPRSTPASPPSSASRTSRPPIQAPRGRPTATGILGSNF